MRIIISSVIAAAMLFILSCNQSNRKASDAGRQEVTEISTEPVATPPASDENMINDTEFKQLNKKENPETPQKNGEKQKQPQPQEKITKPDWDKKIVKTASVNLEVKDYNNYYASVRDKVKNLGGYIAQEEQGQSDYKIENTMVIKVPVDQFDNAVVQLTANTEKINERKISSQDVTTEVIDTKSRIEAKKQVRQRYMDLLTQAKNMQEILSVQSEINGIQEEIESAAGRVEYLSHSSVFSTINLTYFQVLNSSAKDSGAGELSFGEKVKGAFKAGWEIVSDLFIVVITIWPLLLASFFGYLLLKKLRIRKTKQA